MRNILLLLQILLLFGCQGNTEIKQKENTNDSISNLELKKTNLYDILESKFGQPITIEKEAEIFDIYKWESFETEYGKKFKNEIDKALNILPFKTDTELKNDGGDALIIDTYQWETPQVFVELVHSFKEINNKIKSNIKVRMNYK